MDASWDWLCSTSYYSCLLNTLHIIRVYWIDFILFVFIKSTLYYSCLLYRFCVIRVYWLDFKVFVFIESTSYYSCLLNRLHIIRVYWIDFILFMFIKSTLFYLCLFNRLYIIRVYWIDFILFVFIELSCDDTDQYITDLVINHLVLLNSFTAKFRKVYERETALFATPLIAFGSERIKHMVDLFRISNRK